MPDLQSALIGAKLSTVPEKRAAADNAATNDLPAPTDKDRAGRAPYNFVPPPEKVRMSPEFCPPSADRYHDGRHSGSITIRIEAETDFYTRGTWTLTEFVDPKQERQIKDQELPFFAGKRLPGSSLRGMIRSLVEILADAPLDPVSRQRFAFRTLGGSDDSTRSTYEPCHPTWAARINTARGGYLTPTKDDKGWTIQPAKSMAGLGTFCKFPDNQFDQDPAEVKFSKPAVPPGSRDNVPVAAQCLEPHAPGAAGLLNSGWRIRSGEIKSGGIKGKAHQWIIYEPDQNAAPLSVPESSVLLHKEAGLIDWIRQLKGSGFKTIPCFFSQFGGQVWFGKTRNFKVPYVVTTEQANPSPRPNPPACWDLAEAIFGRLTRSQDVKGARSRVFFEDAFLLSGCVDDTRRVETILAAPKPTTFQHYLKQTSWKRADSIPWSHDRQPVETARLRGSKMYWRRKVLPAIPDHSHDSEKDRKKHNTVFQKVVVKPTEKPVFEAKVRFENLNDVELGAFLCAIDLPSGLRHQFGMAKPYGLGVMHISIQRIEIMCPKTRYGAFFESKPQGPAGQLCHGLTKDEARGFKETFAKWHGQESVDALWRLPRFRELAALMAWDELGPIDADTWNCMTRYLEFGKLVKGVQKFDYNEYLCVGHGDEDFPPIGYQRPKPRQERRRALPLASQVLEDARRETGRILPSDCKPSFVPPNRQQALAPAQPNRPGPQGNHERQRHR